MSDLGKRWYAHSHTGHDIPRGVIDQRGWVIADCALVFQALTPWLGRTVFDQMPPNPGQVCPTCAAAADETEAH